MSQVVFKEPEIPVKRLKKKKNKVLDEDTYLDRMGKIIERDFFPDLKKLIAQNDYLEAVEKNDTSKLREIYAKYTCGGRLPTERYYSPATFETPLDCRPSDEPSPIGDEKSGASSSKSEEGMETTSPSISSNKGLSLNQYLANYTSEDNKSFEDIMEETEARKRQKYPWLYKEEKSNSEALDEGIRALESGEETKRPLNLDTWGYKNRNYIMYVPDGVSLTEEEMKLKTSQEVLHSNTRFQGRPFDDSQSKEKIQGLAQQQVKVLDGKIGVDGKEVVGSPRVGGYSFLKTPSPAPGVTDSPLMTWGEIEGTPFRLDAGDSRAPTPGPSFRIPDPPQREKLAHALADRRAGEHRHKKKRAAVEAARRHLTTVVSPTCSSSSDRLRAMSPAARRLASTQLRKAVGTADRALIASYSPHLTPSSIIASPSPSPSPIPSKITTDNLLNINLSHRRPKASDFFQ